jgi:hypothetical protein
MAQTFDDTLEAKLRELEASVRALRTADPFGILAATDAALVEMNGVASTVGGVGWVSGTPYVVLYVGSGRLRVEVAAALVASGNHASAYMSWAVHGPALTQAAALSAPVAIAPAYDRAVEVQHNGNGQDQRGSFGTFGTHPGLAPGWYMVQARYALSYSGSPLAPYGGISNRRISAMAY